MPTGPYAEEILRGIDRAKGPLNIAGKAGSDDFVRRIRTSEIGHCSRRIGYRLSRTPRAGSPFAERPGTGITFRLGDFLEALILAGMREAGFPIWFGHPNPQREIVIDDPPGSGHPDGETVLPNEGPALIETKSANSRRFSEMVRKGMQQSNPDYYAQAQRYMHHTDLPQTLFVVANKNDSDLYTEIVLYDPVFAESLEQKARTIWELHERGELPPPEFPKSSWACRVCPYAALCDGKPRARRAGKEPFRIG